MQNENEKFENLILIVLESDGERFLWRQKYSCDDDLHPSISPTRLNSTNMSKTDEETKNLQQSPPPFVKNLQIPSYSYTKKLNPKSKRFNGC